MTTTSVDKVAARIRAADAGRLPPADELGRRYLKIPIRMDDAN